MEAIEFGDFLERSHIPRLLLGLDRWRSVDAVVSLKEITEVTMILAMPFEYLRRLVTGITLAGDPNARPFSGATIRCIHVDPNDLYIGQTFVSRPKYTALTERFRTLSDEFALPQGFSRLTPFIVVGRTLKIPSAIAHYVPPMVEVHGGKRAILDGIHRDFIMRNIGATVQAILIDDISAPFPCALHPWTDVAVVDTKPAAMQDRYFELNMELFRDLKFIGIDG